MERMWRLGQLQYDEAIPGNTVYVDGEGPSEDDPYGEMAKADAIALAHSRGMHLIVDRPADADEDDIYCQIKKLAIPPRWESDPSPQWKVDEALWFIGTCGNRDYLVGSGHTFTGRMSAWCPEEQQGYSVSKYEISEMSPESRYWIEGFMWGNEPDYPYDDEGNVEQSDDVAWRESTARFRRNGIWAITWLTCEVCGVVLLPDGGEWTRCAEHAEQV